MAWLLAAVAVMLLADSLFFLFAPHFVKKVVEDLAPWELRLVGAIEFGLVIALAAFYIAGRLSGRW